MNCWASLIGGVQTGRLNRLASCTGCAQKRKLTGRPKPGGGKLVSYADMPTTTGGNHNDLTSEKKGGAAECFGDEVTGVKMEGREKEGRRAVGAGVPRVLPQLLECR